MKLKYLAIPLAVCFAGLLAIFITTANFFVLEEYKGFDPKAYTLDSDGSIQAYVINLDKSKERLAYITPQLQNLGYNFERIRAVYGKEIPQEERDRLVSNKLNRENIAPGVIGCYLSHMKTWKTFLESKHKYALIFEDDVKFDHKTLRKVVDGILQTKSKWDIVNIDLFHYGYPSAVEKIPGTECSLCKYRTRVSHMGCYIINRNAAIKLLSKALPILMEVDQYFSRSWELGTVFRGVEPRIVRQEFGDSEIMSQKPKEKERSLGVKINGWVFSLKTDIAFFVHSLFH